MKRMQIYLTNSEIDGINKLIEKNGGGTKSDIVRRAVDYYLSFNTYNNILTTDKIHFDSWQYKLAFKDNNDKISYCEPNQFICTGIPPQFDDAVKQAREYGASSLGTIGYFKDRDGFLRDAGQIVKFI